MPSFLRRCLVLLVCCQLVWAANLDPPAAAVKMLALFRDLQEAQRDPSHRVRFELSEAEITEYMRYSLAVTPRPGLESVLVKIFPNNYISTFSTIDFDAVERWKPGTIPALLRPVLSGKRTVWVDVRFNAHDGKTTFAVEKAYFEKVPLPAFAVNKVIQVLGARQPEKYDTSGPLPLPFGLKKAWTADKIVRGEN